MAQAKASLSFPQTFRRGGFKKFSSTGNIRSSQIQTCFLINSLLCGEKLSFLQQVLPSLSRDHKLRPPLTVSKQFRQQFKINLKTQISVQRYIPSLIVGAKISFSIKYCGIGGHCWNWANQVSRPAQFQKRWKVQKGVK